MELENYWKILYFSKEQQQQFYNKYPFIDFDESNTNSIESEGFTNNEENEHDDNNKIEEIISTIEINQTSNTNETSTENKFQCNENGDVKDTKNNCISTKKYSDEAILSAYEKEILKMEKLYEEAKDVLELVGKHIRLVEEVKNFEISCADQTRLFQKGKRDPGRLLREEKFRKRIARERPKLEKELIKILSDWEIQNNKPFTIYGKRYLDSIKSLDDEVSKLVMNEKEKHKSKSHSKNLSDKNINSVMHTPHKKNIPKTPKHIHQNRVKRQRINSNEDKEKRDTQANENNRSKELTAKTPRKNIPSPNDWKNITETPKTERTLIDNQKLLYTTSRIPITPSQPHLTRNYPMSARTHSRIPMLTLKNAYKKTNLFSIKLPQKRQFYFSDDEEDEEKREIFENFAKKSKDLNEILQKFKKTPSNDSLNNKTLSTTTAPTTAATTTTNTTTTTSSSTNFTDSKSSNNTMPSKIVPSSDIISNNNPLSTIEELSSIRSNSNSNPSEKQSDATVVTPSSHTNNSNLKGHKKIKKDEIQVEIEDQLQSVYAMQSPTKSKIKLNNTIVSSLQEEKENLSKEINVRKESLKVMNGSEVDTYQKFSHPLTMNNTLVNINTPTQTNNNYKDYSTNYEVKSKILPSFSTTKISLSNSLAKESGTFVSPKKPLASLDIKASPSPVKPTATTTKKTSIKKANQESLEPLKEVKQEEEDHVITVATPIITTTNDGQEIVEDYQYEKINLAEPSALTIKIKNPSSLGIGDIGDKSLSSIDGEEGVDSFIDDVYIK
jgi:hypothetical protein